jgi:hypothetical protein
MTEIHTVGAIEWDDEDHYDPTDDRGPQEEPNCYDCGDGGTTPRRWPLRRYHRPCPSCYGPTILDRLAMLVATTRYRLNYARRRRRGQLPPHHDEAPF